jgi:hypothetical protein
MCISQRVWTNEIFLEVCEFQDGQLDRQPIIKYALPVFTRDARFDGIRAVLGTVSQFDPSIGIPHTLPFLQPPCREILVFEFSFSSIMSTWRKTLVLVVPQTICFPTPEQIGLQTQQSSTPVPIPWDLWGPSNSRWFDTSQMPISKWSRNVHGYRLVTPNRVYDFNQLSIARDIARGQTESIIAQPTMLPVANGIFNCDVVSSLPYRFTNIPRNAHGGGINLDHGTGLLADDYLIEVKQVRVS